MGGSRRRGRGVGRRAPGRPRSQRGPTADAPPRISKAERAAEQRRVRRRRTTRNRVLAGLLAAAAVALLVTKNVTDRRQSQRLDTKLTAGSCTSDRRSDGGSTHVTSPTFRVDPPSGGDHTPAVAAAGAYEEANVPPEDQLVHAMEHGYVILWQRPDSTEADRSVVDDIASQFEKDVLVVRRSSLNVPLAATAWHRRLLCRNVEQDTLTNFARAYRNKGPEKVPH